MHAVVVVSRLAVLRAARACVFPHGRICPRSIRNNASPSKQFLLKNLESAVERRFALEKSPGKVFVICMNAAIADEKIPDIQSQAHEITRRQLQEWFNWMDGILDIHRNNFVFRQPASDELAQHRTALKAALRTSHFILALIADPDFNEPELTGRLQVRIRQLQDAFDTFHDTTLSDAQAEKILKQVFPE